MAVRIALLNIFSDVLLNSLTHHSDVLYYGIMQVQHVNQYVLKHMPNFQKYL